MADTKVEKLITEISELSVLELSDLVRELQEKFGVSAMPIATAAPSGASNRDGSSSGQAQDEAEKEKSVSATATVVLADAGANKISVIKALREINPELGLKEAKDITEATPKEILTNVKNEEANSAKEKLEAAGATVEMK